ncbi:MAG: nuclear transport factor 2 family protein [Chthoniobacterales bacterium]
MNEESKRHAERILVEWNEALKNNDVERLLVLYAPDAVVESPLIAHLLNQQSGMCRGHEALKNILQMVAARKPLVRGYYKKKYFTDGETLIWEYPRGTPEGEQMDFVEVMELKNGLIQYHRVYWGWYGVNVMKQNRYFRA